MSSSQTRAPELSMQKVGWQTYRTAIWRATERSAERPLLFFNGIGANLELAQPLADAMPERDIITFDMPGIGGSPAAVIPYRPWMISAAAAKILERFGFGDVDVIGVSWGGGAAQQFALQYRRRTKKLILCATSTGMTMIPGNFEALSKMATPRRYLDKDYLMKNFEKLYGDEGDFAGKHHIRIQPPSVRGYIYQMLAMVGWTSLPFLPFLKVPTLVMGGDRDKIVPLINSKMIKGAMPNARLHVVEGGGHLFIITRLPEILPIIRSFLNEPLAEPKAYRAPRPAAVA
ncbi:Putative aminoacrylate hydrolase RutD [Alphaproteobacteria bacterium SO-S41]|nr:Putative aminoacrylate hydrolase RutD [Alphaproteobacteria bacterium SO-S41]